MTFQVKRGFDQMIARLKLMFLGEDCNKIFIILIFLFSFFTKWSRLIVYSQDESICKCA